MGTEKAKLIVDQMFNNDAFSQWLGIKVLLVGEGESLLEMEITDKMTNGFDIAHGGITYSLADSALAFASNGYGQKCVSVETSISHTKPCQIGDVIRAKAEEKSKSNKIAIYEVSIHNQHNDLVALFKGTVYRTSKTWEIK